MLSDSITSIKACTFAGCTNFAIIVIPEKVTSIESGAFLNCSMLKIIHIPDNVKTIGQYAFYGTAWYKSQPNGLIYAGKVAYTYKGRMPEKTNLIIDDGITGIADGAFQNGMAFYLDDEGSPILDDEFNWLIDEEESFRFSNLISVSIPRSVTYIGYDAFNNCIGLESVDIPSSVSIIHSRTFSYCEKLRNLTLPFSITMIEGSAFYACSSLNEIKSYIESPFSIDNNTFSQEVYEQAKLLVPEGTAELYSSLNGWNRFQTIEEFSPPTYALNYVLENTAYKSYQLKEGQTIVPEPAPEKEGYTFSGWEGLPKVMPAYDVTVTGTFIINKYKLTYLLDDEIYTSSEVEYGAAISPEPDLVKEGFTFSGWIGLPERMPAHDVIVTGSFTPNKYKLTYLVDGAEYKSYEVEYMSSITPEPLPAKVGYSFSGWEGLPQTMPAHDVTVTGTFSINSYILTYMVDGEEYAKYEKEYGATITPEPAPTKEGCTFSGWSAIPETMPARDVTVTGAFTPNKYKLTYLVDGTEYKSYEVEYNVTVTPEPAPSKDGYSFSGWEGLPGTMPAHDVTVTGTFSVNSYTLTYIVDGEEYAKYEKEYGASITPEPVPLKEGYSFSGWSAIPETMPARDVTVTGTFSINSYSLTYMIDDEVYKVVEYEYGATITPEPAPEGNYATFEWVGLPETMPAHDVTVHASYETGIATVAAADGTFNIYTTTGALVRHKATDLKGLAAGVYILRPSDGRRHRGVKVVLKR